MCTRTTSPLTQAMYDSLGYQVNLTGRRFSAALAARLPRGMTTAQVGLLAHLAEHPGQSQREISAAVGIDTATLAEMLRRLEARGTVRRERDPDDARRTLVSLQDGVDESIAAGIAAAREVNEIALRGISPAEHRQLVDLLDRIRTNLS